MSDEKSAELLDQFRDGDERAADELFHRYVERLVLLARSRLSGKLGRRIDPEDVVQSAYRSFFAGARKGQYVLQRAGDLWRLLAAITLNKLYRQVERHTAAKRSLDQEQSLSSTSQLRGVPVEGIAGEPSPAEVMAITEQLECVMSSLIPVHRRMLEMRLQGQTVEEIAGETSRSERQVRRLLKKVRQQLEQELLDVTTSAAP